MRPDPRLADRLDVVDGRAEPDRLHDRWRAGLEPVRRLAIGDAVLETSRIISPPPSTGGIAARCSYLPYSAPIPVGP